MGIPWWKSGLFFVAIAIFGIALFPSQREMGRLFTESHLFDRARFYLEKQFHCDPRDAANAGRYLESLRYCKAGEALFIRASKRIAKMHPNNVSIYMTIADYYEDKMDYSQASRYWRRILRIAPRLKDIREKLISYYVLGKYNKELIAFYKEEIKNGCASLDTFYSLGGLYSLKKRAKNAAVIYEKLLRSFPGEEAAKLRLAEAYEYSGDIYKSIALYRELSEQSPKNLNYALKLVEMLMKYKKSEEALEKLAIFSRRFSGNRRFLRRLSDVYAIFGKKKEAISVLESLYAQNPRDYKLKRTLGELYFETNNYDKALEALRYYHEKTGGDYHSHHILGDLLRAMGDTAGSQREYKKALELIRADSSEFR